MNINNQSAIPGSPIPNPQPQIGAQPIAPFKAIITEINTNTFNFEINVYIDSNNTSEPNLVVDPTNHTKFYVQYGYQSETPVNVTPWVISGQIISNSMHVAEKVEIYLQDTLTGNTSEAALVGKGDPETSRGTETTVEGGTANV